jgi:LIM domain kinase 1
MATELVRKINSLNPGIFNIDYKDLENVVQIGGGNFGQVSKGTYFGTEVAIKQLLDVDDKDMHKYIEREMQTLRELRHPNAVQFMGLSRNGTDVYIVTEYIPGGDLRKLLKDEAKELSWLLRARIATDVAYAMTFLHSKGLIHRDLKSNNLLVAENFKIKVCDFGFSRRVNKGEQMTLCGTDEWMAPEVMCGDTYDEKADVFSYAMVLYELITRKKPPLRKPSTGFSFEIEPFKAQSPPDCPAQFIELTIACAQQQPEQRPHFKDVLPKLKVLVKDLEEQAEKEKEKKKKKHHKKDKRDETPEERAKRRAERREKKAAKEGKEGKAEEKKEKKKDASAPK